MIQRARRFGGKVWRRLKWMAGVQPPPAPPLPPAQAELYQFANGDREVWVATPQPPHPLKNILYNESYYTIVDQCARGLGRHMTVPEGLINNVIEEARIVYVRDDETGQFFPACWEPAYPALDSYRCCAGLNFITIESRALGLEVTWRIWVPAGRDPVEIWDVRVRDLTGQPRRVSLFSYAVVKCDGTDLYCGDLFRIARYEPELTGVYVQADAERHQYLDFPWHNGFMAGNREPRGWEANIGEFIGGQRSLINPHAVAEGQCHNSQMAMWAPCTALHFALELPAGGGDELRLIVGAAGSRQMARELRDKYATGTLEACPAFDAMQAAQEALTGNVQLDVPEPTMMRMLNAWVKKQIHYGATWGRWGWRGYRDTVQQSLGILTQDAVLARANLIEACAHQYADGFALRGWRPVDTMRYADSAQWLVHAATEYLKETGDFTFLEESVPYFDAGAGPVREHLLRAMERLHEDRGAQGLCLAHGGDWNDSLTGICRRGRGQSVWLSMAFARCCLLMQELFEHLGQDGDAARMQHWHAEMAQAINQHAWDGRWYLCALDDDGRPVGSAQNEEGRLFLNMQSWGQLARVASNERWESSWGAVREHLDPGWGLMLNWPPYTHPDPAIGRMTWIRPGAAENGMVYTHGNAFTLLALLERGLADEALELWQQVAPGFPGRPPCQPNVFFNGYYGPASEILPGLADHAWMTGSVAWMYHCVVEVMLGLRRGYDGLRVQPCLPSLWPRASATRTFRGTAYEVTILNPAGRQASPVARIEVDGQPHPASQPLPLDGGKHKVVVTLSE